MEALVLADVSFRHPAENFRGTANDVGSIYLKEKVKRLTVPRL